MMRMLAASLGKNSAWLERSAGARSSNSTRAAWADRWRSSDIEVGGDPAAEQALRFAVYHLNSAANPADEHVSIGARGLTGDDYQGHVFWDTEIYLLPFYSFTWPKAARALLMYRFRTIEGAREKAARMGWRGAMYAWEWRIPVRRRRRSRLLVRMARSSISFAGSRNSTLPQTSRTRSGSIGRQPRM